MDLITTNINKIQELCIKHKVGHLYVFGSVLSNKFQNQSDIDMIVDFNNVDLYNYADNYFDFKYSLEKIFEREVDLLEEKAINNPYLKESINSSKQLIYG